MTRLILVCGPTAVGKTTYSLALADEIKAVRFSIDPWMQTLFAKDMVKLDYAWMVERVNRCHEQIWDIARQILLLNGNVILDLGFTDKSQREKFSTRAKELGINSQLHYLDAPKTVRKQRLNKRNKDKNPDIYAFEVTQDMFNFMESKFEIPDENELENGLKIDVS